MRASDMPRETSPLRLLPLRSSLDARAQPAAGESGSGRQLAGSLGAISRRVAFVAVAAFLLLGPAPGQLFGAHSFFLREWIMFAGVGVGIPKGVFTLHTADGAALPLTPTQVVGVTAYPQIRHYLFDKRVFEDADIKLFAGRVCDQAQEGERLSFEGFIGTRLGWRAVSVDDICALPDPVEATDEGSAP